MQGLYALRRFAFALGMRGIGARLQRGYVLLQRPEPLQRRHKQFWRDDSGALDLDKEHAVKRRS